MPVQSPIPTWQEVEESENWKNARPEDRDVARQNWLLAVRKFQKAGLIDGTPDDIIRLAKERGILAPDRTLAGIGEALGEQVKGLGAIPTGVAAGLAAAVE